MTPRPAELREPSSTALRDRLTRTGRAASCVWWLAATPGGSGCKARKSPTLPDTQIVCHAKTFAARADKHHFNDAVELKTVGQARGARVR